jgi:transcriptional repressor NrdR
MGKLRELDYIAYIRFASVYRDFTDITDLKQEVDTLLGNNVEVLKTGNQLSLLPDDNRKTLSNEQQKERR